ncbi:MAG: hypothetical protein OSA78_00630 [Flavobacteriales bacterium]|nr:hypothetical protein [Flavobacteriales bacterium]
MLWKLHHEGIPAFQETQLSIFTIQTKVFLVESKISRNTILSQLEFDVHNFIDSVKFNVVRAEASNGIFGRREKVIFDSFKNKNARPYFLIHFDHLLHSLAVQSF